MAKPSFIVVGAAKSGTTSLYEYLRRDPRVFLPRVKEIGYFSGLPRSPKTFDQYLSFFADADDGQIVGEVSSSYLSSCDAARRVSEELGPDVQIVAVLRNPVDMVYSLWGQNQRSGIEDRSFEQAFFQAHGRSVDSVAGTDGSPGAHSLAYQQRGCYFDQVRRFTDRFHGSVHILLFEEVFADVRASMLRLGNIIGISSIRSDEGFRVYNPSSRVRWKWLHRLYFEPSALSRIAARIIPTETRRALMLRLYYLNTKEVERPPLSPEFRERLYRFFEPDILKLQNLLGRPLVDVWSPKKTTVGSR